MSSAKWRPFCLSINVLTHWGWVTHICMSDLTSIGSDNGLSPGRRQAIIRTNAGILLIRPLGINFSEILIEIQIYSFKKMRLKVSSAQRRPFCLCLNVLIHTCSIITNHVLPHSHQSLLLTRRLALIFGTHKQLHPYKTMVCKCSSMFS